MKLNLPHFTHGGQGSSGHSMRWSPMPILSSRACLRPPMQRTRISGCRLLRDLFWRAGPATHSLIIKNPPGQQLEKTLRFLQAGAVSVGISLSTRRGSEGCAGSVGEENKWGEEYEFLLKSHCVCSKWDLPLRMTNERIILLSFMDCKGAEGWGGWDLLLEGGLESDNGPYTITKFVFYNLLR